MNKKETIITFAIALLTLSIFIGGAVFLSKKQNKKDAATINVPATTTQTTSSTGSDQNIGKYVTLEKIDTVVGTGKEAKNGSQITVNYTGRLPDGTVFDSSLNEGREPFQFVLGNKEVIDGWDEGLLDMKVGGKRTLKIPTSLGYGENPPPSEVIKPNYDLEFDVELLNVE